MTAQAAVIAETIVEMKKALYDRYDSSNSDDALVKVSNRGKKLKRKAQFMHEGQLSGERVYKRKVEHAGYYRFILHRNPKRYDEYGDELEDDEVDFRADAEAADGNPYGNVKLEELLMPLTSAAELSNHPSLSIPYQSSTLSNMVQQTSEMVHKEKRTLWTVKHLLTKFRGDSNYVPGDYLLSTDDAALFPIETIQDELNSSSIPTQLNGHKGTKEKASQYASNRLAVSMHSSDIAVGHPFRSDEEDMLASKLSYGASQHDRSPQPVNEARITTNQKSPSSAQNSPQPAADMEGETVAKSCERLINDSTHTRNLDQQLTVMGSTQELNETNNSRGNNIGIGLKGNHGAQATLKCPKEDSEALGSAPLVDGVDSKEDVQVPARRMRTRAQAQAVSVKTLSSHTRSLSPDTSEPNCIHPLYLMPHSAVPDRDLGLPSLEAEETRRILMMWVQKQEEVVRGVERLYGDLLKADRMRKMVIKWCKAQGHIGEMSDGEDWYDKEEWGLEEDLKKGQLEEEDETTNQGKKTRGRRVAQ
ncbi:hypothetical protein MMC17_003603 [Xylographa soralifera]|nr:hypothetical protein [Xylographa soralifera]